MADLFNVLDGIINSDDRDATLADADQVINYAEACGENISYAQAAQIISTGKTWLYKIESGNGEWDRFRREAKAELED